MQSIHTHTSTAQLAFSRKSVLVPAALALLVTAGLIGGLLHAFDARSQQVASDTRQAIALARQATADTPEPVVGIAGAVVQGFVRPATVALTQAPSWAAAATEPAAQGALENIVVVGKRMTPDEIAQARADIAREQAERFTAANKVAMGQSFAPPTRETAPWR